MTRDSAMLTLEERDAAIAAAERMPPRFGHHWYWGDAKGIENG